MFLIKIISAFGIFTMITAMSWSTGLDSAMDDLNTDKSSSGLDYVIEIEQEELVNDDIRTAEPQTLHHSQDLHQFEAPSTETSEKREAGSIVRQVEQALKLEAQQSIFMGCLAESYQNYGVRNWYVARIQQKSWNGGSVLQLPCN